MAVTDNGRVMRRTGLPLLPLLPWGSHISMFHQTPQDLLDVARGFFRAGLADNECGIWALPHFFDREEAVAGLREVIPGFDGLLASGLVELFPAGDWYLKGGRSTRATFRLDCCESAKRLWLADAPGYVYVGRRRGSIRRS